MCAALGPRQGRMGQQALSGVTNALSGGVKGEADRLPRLPRADDPFGGRSAARRPCPPLAAPSMPPIAYPLLATRAQMLTVRPPARVETAGCPRATEAVAAAAASSAEVHEHPRA